MELNFDGEWWNDYFLELYVPQIEVLVDSILKKVLPSFHNIESDSEKFADDKFNKLMEEPANEDFDENMIASYAEYANECGADYYLLLNGVRQSLLNICTVMLHHLFNQQLIHFLKYQVLAPNEIYDTKIDGFQNLDKRISKVINIRIFKSYKVLEELRILANTIKHGEGNSESLLRTKRPDLYKDPMLKGNSLFSSHLITEICLPMAGQDIFVSTNDIENYKKGIIEFYEEFGQKIAAHSIKQR